MSLADRDGNGDLPGRRRTRDPAGGAAEHAAAFRSLESHFRELADELRGRLGILDQAWRGRSRERFFDRTSTLPSRLDSYAGELAGLAHQIETATVVIHETIYVSRERIN